MTEGKRCFTLNNFLLLTCLFYFIWKTSEVCQERWSLLLEGLISKRKQLQITELCLLPRKPNNFTYRLQVPAKIKVKVCSNGEIHGRSASQYSQWEEAPVYPKGLRTSPTAWPPHAIHIRSVREEWILIETRVDARTRVGSPHLRQQEWCSHRKNAASWRCWEWG